MRLQLRASVDHFVNLLNAKYPAVCLCQHGEIGRVVFKTWRVHSTPFGIDATAADALLVLELPEVNILLGRAPCC
jgi:endonuclease/exonuclease/phosphatase (EEP) superfamily protein YafD